MNTLLLAVLTIFLAVPTILLIIRFHRAHPYNGGDFMGDMWQAMLASMAPLVLFYISASSALMAIFAFRAISLLFFAMFALLGFCALQRVWAKCAAFYGANMATGRDMGRPILWGVLATFLGLIPVFGGIFGVPAVIVFAVIRSQ